MRSLAISSESFSHTKGGRMCSSIQTPIYTIGQSAHCPLLPPHVWRVYSSLGMRNVERPWGESHCQINFSPDDVPHMYGLVAKW